MRMTVKKVYEIPFFIFPCSYSTITFSDLRNSLFQFYNAFFIGPFLFTSVMYAEQPNVLARVESNLLLLGEETCFQFNYNYFVSKLILQEC